MDAGRGERMSEPKLYRLANWFPTPTLRKAMPLWQQNNLRAISTHDLRAPRKGEWYLDGINPAARRASRDMHTPYTIVRIVRIEKVTTEKIVEEL